MTKLPVKDWICKLAAIAFVWLFPVLELSAQPECRSVLGAYLKPVSKESALNWASELTLSPGIMSDRQIFNGMAYLGLGYFPKSAKYQVYFEGAYKYWYSSFEGPGLAGTGTGFVNFEKPEKKHLGFRELYYEYSDRFRVKVGIQSMKTVGSMLLDERVLGVSGSKEWKNVNVRIAGGTVYDEIARMQDVCGTRHLYNLVRGNKVNFVGDKMLDSNFWLAELSLSPGSKKTTDDLPVDEFAAFEEADEFAEFSSGDEAKKTAFLRLKNITARLYEEFGPVFPAYKYYAGTSAGWELGKSVQFQAELLGQFMQDNKAVFWKAQLQKDLFGSSGASTSIKCSYLGIQKIDDEVLHFPSYSNLFKGEVMRLDMMHLPILEVGFDHRFSNKLKSHFGCNYVHQLEGANTHEFNAIYSLKPWKHLHLYAIAAWMQSDLMEKDNYLAKLEARFAF